MLYEVITENKNTRIMNNHLTELGKYLEKKSSGIIFDIGACDGTDSVIYGKLYPHAQVFCFEPLPSNFELIEKNIKQSGLSNITPVLLCMT